MRAKNRVKIVGVAEPGAGTPESVEGLAVRSVGAGTAVAEAMAVKVGVTVGLGGEKEVGEGNELSETVGVGVGGIMVAEGEELKDKALSSLA